MNGFATAAAAAGAPISYSGKLPGGKHCRGLTGRAGSLNGGGVMPTSNSVLERAACPHSSANMQQEVFPFIFMKVGHD